MRQSTSPRDSSTEGRRDPVRVILWVLAGCVVFVVVGLWLTQPRSVADEWDDQWKERTTHDTFEDAWKQVWTPESLNTVQSGRRDDAAIDLAGRAKAPEVEEKPSRSETEEKTTGRTKDETTENAHASRIGESEDGLLSVERQPIRSGDPDQNDAEDDSDDSGPPATELASPDEESSATEAPATDRAGGAGDVAAVTPPSVEAYEDPTALPRAVERRVVTLSLAGNLGGQRLDPKDGYTWGRLGYFFQRELRPPYFLVFPGGGIPGVVKPPTTAGGQVGPGSRNKGSTQRKQSLPSLRPNGPLGSPIFVIRLLASLESAGAVTFYGRGIAQKYRCRVRTEIHYVGGDEPALVDSFTVTESFTTVPGRVAVGPPGRPAFQAAIEKLIKRLRASAYFR